MRFRIPASLKLRLAVSPHVLGFDNPDAVDKSLFQDTPADRAEHKAEQISLEILALANHSDINVGRAVRIAREVVGMAGCASPKVGVGRSEDDMIGIGPVVVQAFPDAAGAFRYISLCAAQLMHLEVFVGTVAKELRTTRSEVGKPGDVLLGGEVLSGEDGSWT